MNKITFETDIEKLAAVPIGTQLLFKTHYGQNAIFFGEIYAGKNIAKMILSEGMDYFFDEISAFAVPKFGEQKDPYAGRYMSHDSDFEVIKVIVACKVGFNIGNALKYIARADKKGDRKADLKKCWDYLNYALRYGMPSNFVHQENNPYTWQEVAEAWGLDAKLTEVLHLIWNGNIKFAIECLSTS